MRPSKLASPRFVPRIDSTRKSSSALVITASWTHFGITNKLKSVYCGLEIDTDIRHRNVHRSGGAIAPVGVASAVKPFVTQDDNS